MSSFDENGKYIKTEWKAGDKITATKLNKIEESIEAVNDNDISRHVEADARLDALEAKDTAHDEELTSIKNTIADNKAAAELGDYDINSRMQFLEEDVEQAVNDMNNAVTTMRNEMDSHTTLVNSNVDAKISAMETEVNTQLDAVQNNMDALQSDVGVLQSDMSVLQSDVGDAQTQTFTVTDAYKFTVDHDGMMPSLVTLDDIVGVSSVDTNAAGIPILVPGYLKNICTVDTSKNYFDDAIFVESVNNGAYTRTDNSLHVTGEDEDHRWCCVDFDIPTLEVGKTYCIFCDNVIVNSGGSAIQIDYNKDYTLEQCLHSTQMYKSGFNSIFTYDNAPDCYIRFHCSLTDISGDVTYENIQVYEVKDIIVPDIELNSIPDGATDKVEDGVYHKYTKRVALDSLPWRASASNTDYSTSEATVFYAYIPDLKTVPSETEVYNVLFSNKFTETSVELTTSAEVASSYTMSSQIERSDNSCELRVTVPRETCPDVASLIQWFTDNEVHVIYETNEPKFEPVNLSIKADKGDTVVINTTKLLTFTHDIQCNTRAQLEVLQEQSQKQQLNINMLENSITALQPQYSISESDSYHEMTCTLPGGIIIKAGVTKVPTNVATFVSFQTPFPIACLTLTTTMHGEAMTSGTQTGHMIMQNKDGFYLIHYFGGDRDFSYIAIGY